MLAECPHVWMKILNLRPIWNTTTLLKREGFFFFFSEGWSLTRCGGVSAPHSFTSSRRLQFDWPPPYAAENHERQGEHNCLFSGPASMFQWLSDLASQEVFSQGFVIIPLKTWESWGGETKTTQSRPLAPRGVVYTFSETYTTNLDGRMELSADPLEASLPSIWFKAGGQRESVWKS